MKKLAVLGFLVLFGFAFSLQASEVADAAKKEKARRNAIEKQRNPAKTFTNADVANIKSQLSYEVKTEEASTSDIDSRLESLTEATNTAARELGQKVEREQESAQAQELKEEREELEQTAKDAQETINEGGGYFTRNIGNQFKDKREAEEKIREIDKKLSEEKNPDEDQQ